MRECGILPFGRGCTAGSDAPPRNAPWRVAFLSLLAQMQGRFARRCWRRTLQDWKLWGEGRGEGGSTTRRGSYEARTIRSGRCVAGVWQVCLAATQRESHGATTCHPPHGVMSQDVQLAGVQSLVDIHVVTLGGHVHLSQRSQGESRSSVAVATTLPVLARTKTRGRDSQVVRLIIYRS